MNRVMDITYIQTNISAFKICFQKLLIGVLEITASSVSKALVNSSGLGARGLGDGGRPGEGRS